MIPLDPTLSPSQSALKNDFAGKLATLVDTCFEKYVFTKEPQQDNSITIAKGLNEIIDQYRNKKHQLDSENFSFAISALLTPILASDNAKLLAQIFENAPSFFEPLEDQKTSHSPLLKFVIKQGTPATLKVTLKQKPIDPSAVDEKGFNALHWAVEENKVDLIPVLLEDGRAKTDAPNHEGANPYELACKLNNGAAMDLLKSKT